MSATYRHIREHRLEAYLLNRLPAQLAGDLDNPRLEALEVHLLGCSECQERAEALEATLELLKNALVKVASEDAAVPKVKTAGS